MAAPKMKKKVVVKEDNRPMGLREKYVERIRDAMTLTGAEIENISGEDYLSALEEIGDDVASMIDAKREEIAAEE